MFGNLSDVIKIPAAIIIGMILATVVMFFTYEGLRLPLFGQVINGRVQSEVAAATKDMVASFRLTAALAQLDKERKDRETADQLRADADKRALAAATARDKAKADLEARIKADTSPDGAVWTEEDIQWQSRH
ncbi:hypothetical protein [Rhizobium sp. 21-4511-3d]